MISSQDGTEDRLPRAADAEGAEGAASAGDGGEATGAEGPAAARVAVAGESAVLEDAAAAVC